MRKAAGAIAGCNVVHQRPRSAADLTALQLAHVVVESLRAIVTARKNHCLKFIELTVKPLLRNRTTRWCEGRLQIPISLWSRFTDATLNCLWKGVRRKNEFDRHVVAHVADPSPEGIR